MTCNIDKTDRINRAIIGALIFLAALLNASQNFYMVLGIVLVFQAAVGWCSIPFVLKLFQK